VSTSTGSKVMMLVVSHYWFVVVPDFRSGMDTKLETGPGVWELSAHKQSRGTAHKTTSIVQAIPSPTHMFLVKMHQVRILIAIPCLVTVHMY